MKSVLMLNLPRAENLVLFLATRWRNGSQASYKSWRLVAIVKNVC
jgi:hypothetical protein